jgi:hypothetical protein
MKKEQEDNILENYLLDDNLQWRKLGAYPTKRSDGSCFPMLGRIEKSIMSDGKVIITERVQICNLKYGDKCLNEAEETEVVFRGSRKIKTGHGSGWHGPKDKQGFPTYVQCYASERRSVLGNKMDSSYARKIVENSFIRGAVNLLLS